MPVVALLALLALPATANASCQSIADGASSLPGAAIPATYARLVACDRQLAEDRFDDFMRASKDVGTLVGLCMAAIDNGVNAPVWGMLEKVPDLSLRDEVAKGVGGSCSEHANVVGFLKGAHSQLRDRQFNMWTYAFRVCEAEELDSWLREVVVLPPSVSYDDKYNTVTEALVKRQRGAALPTLAIAAKVAGKNGGPFTTLLDRMNESVRPESFGADISGDDRVALEAALVDVAQALPSEQAAQVADRLYQAGAESAAASLLPTIYADRVQGKGVLTYGVAAIESCDKEAIVHFASVTEPSKRWSILDDVTPMALAFKPKLKCVGEGSWPVMTTSEPILGKNEIAEWAEGLVADWQGRGLEVKLREEKGLTLE
jgi:hypothetical protein